MEATERLKRQGLRGGGLCKRGMNREAIGKKFVMAGLKTWFKQNWVDIGSKRKDGSFLQSVAVQNKRRTRREYQMRASSSSLNPMSEGQRRSAVTPGNGQLPMWDLNLQT